MRVDRYITPSVGAEAMVNQCSVSALVVPACGKMYFWYCPATHESSPVSKTNVMTLPASGLDDMSFIVEIILFSSIYLPL